MHRDSMGRFTSGYRRNDPDPEPGRRLARMGYRYNPAKDVMTVVGLLLLAGAVGAGVDLGMQKIAPPSASGAGLKTWQRGGIQIALGLIAGALLGFKWPRVGVAIGAANAAIGGSYVVLDARTRLAASAAAQQQVQAPAPPPPAVLPTGTPTTPAHGFAARRYPAYMAR